MKVLVDMNLSPSWVELLTREGFHAKHWSHVGDLRANDLTIMQWARREGYIVFTHDLDFGALLAATHAEGPSVIQVRTQDILPSALGLRMIAIIRRHAPILQRGALVTIDEVTERTRILPFT